MKSLLCPGHILRLYCCEEVDRTVENKGNNKFDLGNEPGEVVECELDMNLSAVRAMTPFCSSLFSRVMHYHIIPQTVPEESKKADSRIFGNSMLALQGALL